MGRKIIIVERASGTDDWMARYKNQIGVGRTIDTALGDLVRRYGAEMGFNIRVVNQPIERPRQIDDSPLAPMRIKR